MYSRHRIYPINEEQLPAINKYAGLRKEADEFRAKMREISKQRKIVETAAVAAAPAKKPHLCHRKSRPNLFTSTFSGLINEWFTFHWYNLKDWVKDIKHTIVPTLFCLRAEIVIQTNEQ